MFSRARNDLIFFSPPQQSECESGNDAEENPCRIALYYMANKNIRWKIN